MGNVGKLLCTIKLSEWGQRLYLRDIGSPVPVNEFYKKGCQEKSSALTGGSRLFLEIQPTVFGYPEDAWLGVHSRKLSQPMGALFECERRGKQNDVNHGSIRGSWPIAISGYPRGHSV